MQYRSLDIVQATPHDIDYVVRRMRVQDAREVYGARWSQEPDSVILEMTAQSNAGFYAPLYAVRRLQHPRAVALAGLLLTSPGHAWAHLLATAEWPLIVKDMTRFIRERMISDGIAGGLRRVELRALESWRENCHWLERLGAKCECVCAGLGQEPYVQYAWTRPKEG